MGPSPTEPGGAGAVALGIIVGLLSTSIQSVGLTLQRKSHLLEDEKEEHLRKKPYRRRRWQLGMGMFLIANIVGSSIQITCLPLPVLSTLQASGLVFNSVCATLLLAEPFTFLSGLGTLLVTAGAILIGIFGAMTEPSHNLQQLLDLLGRRQFLLWLFGTLFVVFVVLVGTWVMRRMFPNPNSPKVRFIRGMSFGFISGVLSAHLLLIAKSAVELLVRTIVDRHNQFDRWQSWLILVALIAFALTELYYLHMGLKLCSTSVLYPFVFCVYNIVTIVDGLIYFHQSSRLTSLHAGLIALGTVILLSGVLALSWRLNEPDESPEEPTEAAARFRKRAMSRIATPSTVLAPGLSLVPPSEDMNTGHEDYLESIEDPEAHNTGVSPDERTPLLRTATAPVREVPLSKKRKVAQRPRPGERRMTLDLAEEGREIWDELLDRRRTSRGGESALLSPTNRKQRPVSWSNDGEAAGDSVRAGSAEGVSVKDTAVASVASPLIDVNNNSESNISYRDAEPASAELASHPSVDNEAAGEAAGKDDGFIEDPEDGEETDVSTVLPDHERRTPPADGRGGWYKLGSWWKTPWRGGRDGGGRPEGG